MKTTFEPRLFDSRAYTLDNNDISRLGHLRFLSYIDKEISVLSSVRAQGLLIHMVSHFDSES